MNRSAGIVAARRLDNLEAGGTSRRVVVGIAEFALSDRTDDVVATHALGSCIAVCVWDPAVCVGGILHFLLPDSRINRIRAADQPAAFADTGIPLFFQTAYRVGLQKNRCRVWLIGGAETTSESGNGVFNIGKRNTVAARNLLWKNNVLISGESVGGTAARTVHLWVADGRIEVSAGRDVVEHL